MDGEEDIFCYKAKDKCSLPNNRNGNGKGVAELVGWGK